MAGFCVDVTPPPQYPLTARVRFEATTSAVGRFIQVTRTVYVNVQDKYTYSVVGRSPYEYVMRGRWSISLVGVM